MFINLSNHPSDKWTLKQIEEAKKYGVIQDIAFPHVDPSLTSDDINQLVEEYLKKILAYHPQAVMVQGEYIFTYRMVNKLKEYDVIILASCSERRTIEYIDENGFTERKSEFEFINFKEY